jgi:4-amino-4-deoxy-L-arabinose transferase-like glycosyltransferase
MPDMTTTHDSAHRTLDRIVARRRSVLAVAFVVALAVRVLATFLVAGTDPEIAGDMKSYDTFATAIVEGDWWGRHVSYREPGYPLLVAGVYAITGGNQLSARLVNSLLGALACLAVYALGRRVFGAAVGILAAVWFSVYFHSVHFAPYLLRESLVTLLLLLFLVALFDAARGTRRVRDAVAAGLWYVVLVHVDARFLFHAPFVLLFLLVASGGWKRGLSTAVVLFAVFGAGMVPWQVRNYSVYDRIVLVNTRTLVLEAPWRDYSDTAPVEGLEADPPDTREGVRRLHGVREAVYNFAEFYRVFRVRGEVRNNSNTWERPWSAFHNWSSILGYGVLMPFFILGFWLVLTKRMTPAYVLAAPVLAHTILHLVKWGRDRYRMPIDPVLIIVAFFAMVWLWERFARRRRGAES